MQTRFDAAPSTRPGSSRFLLPVALAGLLAGFVHAGCDSGSKDPAVTPSSTTGTGTGASKMDPAVEATRLRFPHLASNRVILLGMDGCDPIQVKNGIERGDLPNFKRIVDEGAWGPLRSQDPMLSPLLWTSIATGKFPTEHGVLDFTVRARDAAGKRESVTSRQRQVEAMWDIVGRHGKTVEVVGWLASHPADEVNGVMVSERNEHLAYLFNQGIHPSPGGKTWPPDLVHQIQALRREPGDVTFEEIQPYLAITQREFNATLAQEFTRDNRVNNMRLIHLATENFRRVGLDLYRSKLPDLYCTYFESLDATKHYFQCYEEPVTWKPFTVKQLMETYQLTEEQAKALREGTDEGLSLRVREILDGTAQKWPEGRIESLREDLHGADPVRVERWGHAVTAMYRHMDKVLGDYLAAMDENTVLVLVSDHGFKSGKDKPPYDSNFASGRGGAAYHSRDGVLGVIGKGVRRGYTILPYAAPQRRRAPQAATEGARLVDIAPTVLALMGFPKGEDMPGRVLVELFTETLPENTLPTYEQGRSERLVREEMARLRDPEDQERERAVQDVTDLAAIPYIGSAEEGDWRANAHLAASFAEQGRYAEAIEAWTEALKGAVTPQNKARAYAMTATFQMRLRRNDEALATLTTALRELPEDFNVLHAASRIYGLLGRQEECIDALTRLQATPAGSNMVDIPVRLADALRERAATRAGSPDSRRDLERALALVQEAVAKETARRAAEKDPEEADTPVLTPGGRNILGKIYLDLNRTDDALIEFRAAADADPGYEVPRNNLGVTYMRLAFADLRGMEEAADEEARMESFKRMRGKLDEALRWFDAVIELNPDHHKARFNRAEIHTRFPPVDLDAAVKELNVALELRPDYKRARELLDGILEFQARPQHVPPVETPR